VTEGQGLCRLPEPSAGDIFLDFEGDPYVGSGGLEYLLGCTTGTVAEPHYQARWALDASAERASFEAFIDLAMARWERWPDLHIYHFAPYEPAALKRLMGRYATREDELDRLLRAGRFVDLHRIVRQTLRASVERYALKELEVSTASSAPSSCARPPCICAPSSAPSSSARPPPPRPPPAPRSRATTATTASRPCGCEIGSSGCAPSASPPALPSRGRSSRAARRPRR
jgi:hypothetical protein